jgi:hypothetical protein
MRCEVEQEMSNLLAKISALPPLDVLYRSGGRHLWRGSDPMREQFAVFCSAQSFD